MNELQAILAAFEDLNRSGQVAALATVVKVSGSTYRRSGARMLIAPSGRMVGTISGGCLENDVLEHAQIVMRTGQPRVVKYDTTGDEDLTWGLGLGCNGVVTISIECLDPANMLDPLTSIATLSDRQPRALITVFRVVGAVNVSIGTYSIGGRDGTVTNNPTDPHLSEILADVRAMPASQHALVKQYDWLCGSVEVSISWIHPPTSLLIFGAGQDAVPVAVLAKLLGWQVTIVDCRASESTPARFPMADATILTRRDVVDKQVSIDRNTVAVVMTHNYLDDAALLKMLLPSPARYIGILGSKHRTERLLQTIEQTENVCIDRAWERLHAPIGLDIGAELPEAIAVSIVAEIQAVLANRGGGSLKNRQGSIHTQIETLPTKEQLLCRSRL